MSREKKPGKPRELPPEKLKKVCEPSQFKFRTTLEVPPLRGTIGQERAISAIEFGLSIKNQGFNVYVAGPSGTGRTSTIKSYLKKMAEKEKTPDDWCYVHNFSSPDSPLAINLPPGRGYELAKNMEELIKDSQARITQAFESEDYERRKNEAVDVYQKEKKKIIARLEKEAKQKNFSIQITPMGIVTIPMKEGKPLKQEEYEALSREEKRKIDRKREDLESSINQALTRVRKLDKEIREKMSRLDRQIALFALGDLIEDLKQKYKDFPKVTQWLDRVKEDIVNNVETFKGEGKRASSFSGVDLIPRESPFDRYKVNVLVNNGGLKGAPVVIEDNPTYYNLFGRVEYRFQLGGMVTDFTMIKPGALHRANGGYLVVRALDVLLNFLSWDALKRTLRSQNIRIENIGESFRPLPTPTLKPQPVPLRVKVILIGSPKLYHLLYFLEEDFQKLFKVKVDFDVEMKRTPENIQKYASFISSRTRDEELLPFDPTGVAKVVEYGSWLVGDQEKLSTRFMEICDLISEASFWAKKAGKKIVKAKDVEKAIQSKIYRSSLIEEKIQELIREGSILIDTRGQVVGQVNGIALIEIGDYGFGKPTRITARTFLGRKGIINIDREVKLSGKIHNKGVMIISGYLAGKYAQQIPLSLSVSLGFEQLYEEIEGDSASSAELYAILSSLAGVPLRQDVGVTGSVNQRGEIQPVGGVTRKVEGFFDVCSLKGLKGTEGVIIPYQNIKNLMLKDEVIEAVKKGKFHIYPVRTVEEGMEILTGIKAGKRLPDRTYEEGTLNWRIEKNLREMAEKLEKIKEKE